MSKSITGLNPEKCAQRNRLDALKRGVNTASLHLSKQMPAYGEPGGPDHVRGKIPKSDQEALEMINAGLPADAEPLTLDQVYIVPLEAASSNYIEDRSMFLHTSTLKNIQTMAALGFAFMNSHRTGDLSTPSELPFGRVFAGRYERYPAADGGVQPFERVVLYMYMLRGVYPNGQGGPSTDTLYKSIKGGTLFDVSMGLYGGYCMCDMCGNELQGSDCPHYPGTTYGLSQEQQDAQKARGVPDGVATYTLWDAKPSEVSGVYDGAVPGAGFSKAVQGARLHKLPPSALRQAQHAFSHLANKGDFLMNEAVIEQHTDRLAGKIVTKLKTALFGKDEAIDEEGTEVEGTEEEIDGKPGESEAVGGFEVAEDAEDLEDADAEEEEEAEPGEEANSAALAKLSPTAPSQKSAHELELEAKIAELTGEKRLQTARLFVDGLVGNRKLLPALRNHAVARLNQDQLDDEISPTKITLKRPDGSTLSLTRTELTKALFQGLPQHDLLKDHSLKELPAGAIVIPATVPAPDSYQEGLKVGQSYNNPNPSATTPTSGSGK